MAAHDRADPFLDYDLAMSRHIGPGVTAWVPGVVATPDGQVLRLCQSGFLDKRSVAKVVGMRVLMASALDDPPVGWRRAVDHR